MQRVVFRGDVQLQMVGGWILSLLLLLHGMALLLLLLLLCIPLPLLLLLSVEICFGLPLK
jgi:hypothetical protein